MVEKGLLFYIFETKNLLRLEIFTPVKLQSLPFLLLVFLPIQ